MTPNQKTPVHTDEIEMIRKHYGDFTGLYDQGQAVAHVRVLLARLDRVNEVFDDHLVSRRRLVGLARRQGHALRTLHSEMSAFIANLPDRQPWDVKAMLERVVALSDPFAVKDSDPVPANRMCGYDDGAGDGKSCIKFVNDDGEHGGGHMFATPESAALLNQGEVA